MEKKTFELAKESLGKYSIYSLFVQAIGIPEDMDGTDRYALMLDVESGDLFFLDYAVNHNGWNKTAEQQNPWITLGWVSASDILMGDPAGEIETNLLEQVEQAEQLKKEHI